MIDKFEIGKWYIFDAIEYPYGNITWNPYGKMDFLRDGKPHQCTSVSEYGEMLANFDGYTDGFHVDGTWLFSGANDYISEVNPSEEGQFKRGDKILVTDYEHDDDWLEYIFVAYIKGATEPYVVTPADENDFRNGKPFDIYCYKYAKPLPDKDKKLAELEENLRKAQEELEEYKKEKSK